jgi:hypothetical protein
MVITHCVYVSQAFVDVDTIHARHYIQVRTRVLYSSTELAGCHWLLGSTNGISVTDENFPIE